MDTKKTVLVIPVYNNAQVTHECLCSIFACASEQANFEILVVDDGSEAPTKQCLQSHPVTVITNAQNKGYMTSTNRGIRYALDTMQADYVVIMNNDVVVKGPWLQNMLDAMKDYDLCGYTGRKLLFWRRHAKTKYLEGSCIMIKKEVFANIGLLDPLFITGYYSDDDFCLRASLSGFKLGVLNNGLTQTYIKHHEGQTFGIKKLDNMRDEYIRFTNKWEKQRANKLVDVYLRRWRFNPHSLGYRTTLLTHRVLKLGPYRRAS